MVYITIKENNELTSKKEVFKLRINKKEVYSLLKHDLRGSYNRVCSSSVENTFILKSYDLLAYEVDKKLILNSIWIIKCTPNVFWDIFDDLYMFDGCSII